MNLICLFVASGLPVIVFLIAVAVLLLLSLFPRMLWVIRNRAQLAVKLFRRTGWASFLRLASVSGALPGTAIGITMNVGYPGTYSRNGDCIITPRQVRGADAVGIHFGDAVIINQDSAGGTYSSAQDAMTASHTPVMTQGANYAFAGVGVREVLTMTSAFSPQPTVGIYLPGQTADVIERGTVVVQYSNPTGSGTVPVANGPVYLRLHVDSGAASSYVGAFEAYNDAAGGSVMLLLTNCFWTTGVVDANGAAEITITNRNTA